VKEGANGSFTIRLSQIPIAPVAVSVTHYAGTMTLAPAPAAITFTAANWNIPVTVTFNAPKDSDKIDDAATMHVTIVGGASVPVVVRILDTSRSATDPTANITAPFNGQTVSGLVALTGTGTDTNGQVVEGRFLVDGVRIHTDVNSTGRYQLPGRWNTATVTNGWHTIELRVTDNSGKSGRMNIRVLVAN
jgi:Bacterial Ig domain